MLVNSQVESLFIKLLHILVVVPEELLAYHIHVMSGTHIYVCRNNEPFHGRYCTKEKASAHYPESISSTQVKGTQVNSTMWCSFLKLLSQFSDKFEQAIGLIQLMDQLFGVIQLWITSQHCKLGRKKL